MPSEIEIDRCRKIAARIRRGGHPNANTLARDLGMSRRTVRRSMDVLRVHYEAPISYDEHKKGFYFTEQFRRLPEATLPQRELLALLIAKWTLDKDTKSDLGKRLAGVLTKVTDLLSYAAPFDLEPLENKVTYMPPAVRSVDDNVWLAVITALEQDLTLQVHYRGTYDDRSTLRHLEPLHLANLDGEWYLLAREQGGARIRQYTLAKIEQPRALKSLPFERPEDFDAEALLSHTFGRFVSIEKPIKWVHIRIDKKVAHLAAERKWHPRQEAKHTNKGYDIRFPVSSFGTSRDWQYFDVKRWVLSWGRHAKVLAPKELKELVAEELDETAKKYKGLTKRPSPGKKGAKRTGPQRNQG